MGMLTPEEQKSILAGILRDEVRACGGNKRELARKIGVSHPSLIAWLNGSALPDRESAAKLAAYLGYTNTPWEEFFQGRYDERALKIDRLMNLFERLPPEQQAEFLDEFQDRVEAWLKRHQAPSQ